MPNWITNSSEDDNSIAFEPTAAQLVSEADALGNNEGVYYRPFPRKIAQMYHQSKKTQKTVAQIVIAKRLSATISSRQYKTTLTLASS